MNRSVVVWRETDGSEASSELEALRPYLLLAREIRLEVDRLVADDDVTGPQLADAIDALPAQERNKVALAAFNELSAERRWDIIEAAFGDDEIRSYLAAEREARRADASRNVEARAVARAARLERRLATDTLPAGFELRLGLFLPDDVQGGLEVGEASEVCARLLVMRTTEEPGRMHVLDDRFNPRHGLFVTPDYDQQTWERNRLVGHQQVRVGSLVENGEERRFEPAIYPGGRVDYDVDGAIRAGTLLVGFATFGDEDVFQSPN